MIKDKITLEAFRQLYLQPVIDIGKIEAINGDPLYKSLPYWRRYKLLPFFPESNWGYKVSIGQLIWLRILDNLRALGYAVSDTVNVADYFFKDAYFDELPTKNLMARKQQLVSKKKLDEVETLLLLEIERILQDSLLLYGLKFDINYLTNLIAWSVNMGSETGILIFPNGRVAELKDGLVSSHNKDKFDFEAPHIYFSINSLLKEFVDDKELAAVFSPFILDDDEKYVIRELRKKNIKEVKVLLHSAKIMRIDSKTNQTITDEEAAQLKKILHLRNYEEITICTRDNKTLSFNRINKTMTSGKPGSKD